MTRMRAEDLTWEPPGPGQWYASAEHMPTPGCLLLVELLPGAARGWGRGADAYGLAPNGSMFGSSNRWFYFSPGGPGAVDVEALDRRAAETLATRRWRAELARWHQEVRPRVVATSRGLVGERLGALDDAELADHVRRAIAHFVESSPLHFAAIEGAASAGALLQAAGGWGLDPRAVLLALSGSGMASSAGERLLGRIADGLRAAGVTDPNGLDAIRAVGGDAGAALDELLVDLGWRVFNVDLLEPTLAERPQAVLAAVRGALAGWSPRRRPDDRELAALRSQVPAADQPRFDELAADARAAYGYNDDNSSVLFSMPLGLVRRAVLEVGRRLVEQGRALEVDHAFEATTAELDALLAGAGPSRRELAERATFRRDVARITAPPALGEPLTPPMLDLGPSTLALEAMFDAFRQVAWARGGEPGRAAVTVGTEVVRGRAVVVIDPVDALLRMEPGDVLVAATTTATFNTIFPLAGAVAVQEGSLLSHPAVLARELGLTAVIGVPDLLTRVADGDLVEVDPVTGTIRVVEAAR
jgi:phosphohistidine swiveling domain-containing protein